MIFTLAHARSFLAPHIDGGSCDNDKIDARINECTMHLIEKADWKLLVRRVRFFCCSDCLTLPHCFEKVLTHTIGHIPGYTWSKYYEFLPGGPGRIDGLSDSPDQDLVDLGGWYATYNDIPHEYWPLKIFAMSTEESDTELTLNVRGSTTYNDQVLSDGVPGIEVPINYWVGGVEGTMVYPRNLQLSAQSFKGIHSIVKPVTKGYITLYAYNPDYTDGEDGIPMLYYLGKYGPDETNPGYRRYKIVQHMSSGDHVIALVKLAYVPAKHANDVLLIQSLLALKAMSKSIDYYNAEKDGEGQNAEARAYRLLQEQMSNHEQSGTEFSLQYDGFSLGTIDNIL